MTTTETTAPVNQSIIDLANSVGRLTNGCRFMSLTYTSKKHQETARYTLLVGQSYHNLVEKSIAELLVKLPTLTGIDKEAGEAVLASLQKTMVAHAAGQQNADYTKKDQYSHVSNGVNINLTDNSIQLFGTVVNKVVLVPGVYPVVNSRPLTIAKNKITKDLSIGKFREFALDAGVILGGKLNGETFEC